MKGAEIEERVQAALQVPTDHARRLADALLHDGEALGAVFRYYAAAAYPRFLKASEDADDGPIMVARFHFASATRWIWLSQGEEYFQHLQTAAHDAAVVQSLHDTRAYLSLREAVAAPGPLARWAEERLPRHVALRLGADVALAMAATGEGLDPEAQRQRLTAAAARG